MSTYRYFLQCGREFRPWLDTALCCASHFYRHILTNRIICDICYSEVPPSDNYYDLVRRHYICIGNSEEEHEQCQNCSTIIPYTRPSTRCSHCCAGLILFIRFLRESGETPHLNGQSYVVNISETTQCAAPREE